MSVALYRKDGSLDPIASTSYRQFACTKAYFEANKNTIPDGTIVFITDDTDEQVKEITANIVRVYASESVLPTSGLGISEGQYAWAIAEKKMYVSSWLSESAGTVQWTSTDISLLSRIYPVGTVYINRLDDTNPSDDSLLGFGNWTRINGSFLYSTDASEAAGGTGGSTTVTLTTDNLPSHSHTVSANGITASISGNTGWAGGHSHGARTFQRTQNWDSSYMWGPSSVSAGGFGFNYRVNNWNEDINSMSMAATDVQRDYYPTNDTLQNAAGDGFSAMNGAGRRVISAVQDHVHSLNGNIAISFSVESGTKGSGSSFSILPPYTKVHMWYRAS